MDCHQVCQPTPQRQRTEGTTLREDTNPRGNDREANRIPSPAAASPTRRSAALAAERLTVERSFRHVVYLGAAGGQSRTATLATRSGKGTVLEDFVRFGALGDAFGDSTLPATASVVCAPCFSTFPNRDVCRAAELAHRGEAVGRSALGDNAPADVTLISEAPARPLRRGGPVGHWGDARDALAVPLPTPIERGHEPATVAATLFGLSRGSMNGTTATTVASDASTTISATTTTTTSTKTATSSGRGVGMAPGGSEAGSHASKDSGGSAATVDFSARPRTAHDCRPQRTLLGCFSLSFASLLCRDAGAFRDASAAAPLSFHSSRTREAPSFSEAAAGQGGGNSGRTRGVRALPTPCGSHSVEGETSPPSRVIPALTALFYALQTLEVHLERGRGAHLERLHREAVERKREGEVDASDLDSVLGAQRKRCREGREAQMPPRADSGRECAEEEEGDALAAAPLEALKGTVIAEKVWRGISREETDEGGASRSKAGEGITRSKRLREKAAREAEEKEAEGGGQPRRGVETPQGVRDARRQVHALWQELLSLCPRELCERGYLEWWLRHPMNNSGSGGKPGTSHHAPPSNRQASEEASSPSASSNAAWREAALTAAYGLAMQQEANEELYESLLSLLRELGQESSGLMHDRLAWLPEDATRGAALPGARPALASQEGVSRQRGSGRLAFTPCASLANTPQRHQGRSRTETPVAHASGGGAWDSQGGGCDIDGGDPWHAAGRQGTASATSPRSERPFLPSFTAAAAALHVPAGLACALAILHVLLSLHGRAPPSLAALVEDRDTVSCELLLAICEVVNRVPTSELLSATWEAKRCLAARTVAATVVSPPRPAQEKVISPRSQSVLLLLGQSLSLAAAAASRLHGLRMALRTPLAAYVSRLSRSRAAITGRPRAIRVLDVALPNEGTAEEGDSSRKENFLSNPRDGGASAGSQTARKTTAAASSSSVRSPQSPLSKLPQAASYTACGKGVGKPVDEFDRECACVAAILPFTY